MGRILTENQLYPICPYCASELIPEDIFPDIKNIILNEEFLIKVKVVCPECNEKIRVIANITYSSYKNKKKTNDEDKYDDYGEYDDQLMQYEEEFDDEYNQETDEEYDGYDGYYE